MVPFFFLTESLSGTWPIGTVCTISTSLSAPPSQSRECSAPAWMKSLLWERDGFTREVRGVFAVHHLSLHLGVSSGQMWYLENQILLLGSPLMANSFAKCNAIVTCCSAFSNWNQIKSQFAEEKKKLHLPLFQVNTSKHGVLVTSS